MSHFPIRVGIIGAHPDKGWAATAHIPALQALPQYKIMAVSHHDGATARAAAAKFGAPLAFASAADMVVHPELDLIVVAVKVTRHRELVSLAINAGKAVFSEWPLGVSLADAQAMQALASQAGVATAIGLQTRFAPAFAHARKLVADGYVGKVLSATMIGSGIIWGEAMSDAYAYTLDPANGAAMLNVPFAHSVDGLLHVLDARVATVAGVLGNARKHIRLLETGADAPMAVADQVLLAAQLDNGAALSVHFRGGLSRATNFHVEINGTEGDLVITSPVGYVGVGGMQLQGARGEETLHALDIPASYSTPGADGAALLVANAYAQLAQDLATGSRGSPDFGDAVALHALIERIAQQAKGMQ